MHEELEVPGTGDHQTDLSIVIGRQVALENDPAIGRPMILLLASFF